MSTESLYKKAVLKTDRDFSKFIRYRDSSFGSCVCFTCGVVKPIDEMQCGHFISRACLALRWDDKNAHAQCFDCNVNKRGNMKKYAERLTETYGAEIIKYLFDTKHKVTVKYSVSELNDLALSFKAKASALKT